MANQNDSPGEGQPDFEAMAAEAGGDGGPGASNHEPQEAPGPSQAAELSADDAASMAEALLAQVHAAVNDANAASGGHRAGSSETPPGAAPMSLPDFPADRSRAMPAELDLLADVNLNVKIELGRTRMLVEDVLKLSDGAVVELDKLAGDPVDIYVNERHVARGEVLVLNDNFCVRINEIVEPEERRAG